jgi:hypothetical protein
MNAQQTSTSAREIKAYGMLSALVTLIYVVGIGEISV